MQYYHYDSQYRFVNSYWFGAGNWKINGRPSYTFGLRVLFHSAFISNVIIDKPQMNHTLLRCVIPTGLMLYDITNANYFIME